MTTAYVTKGNDVIVRLDDTGSVHTAGRLLWEHKEMFGDDFDPYMRSKESVGSADARSYKSYTDYVTPVEVEEDATIRVAVFKNSAGEYKFLDDTTSVYLLRHRHRARDLGKPHPEDEEYKLCGETVRLGRKTRKVWFPFHVSRTRAAFTSNRKVNDHRYHNRDDVYDPREFVSEDELHDEDYVGFEHDTPVPKWIANQLQLAITL